MLHCWWQGGQRITTHLTIVLWALASETAICQRLDSYVHAYHSCALSHQPFRHLWQPTVLSNRPSKHLFPFASPSTDLERREVFQSIHLAPVPASRWPLDASGHRKTATRVAVGRSWGALGVVAAVVSVGRPRPQAPGEERKCYGGAC